MPTWPLFQTTADVEALVRELVLERLEIREAKARGYDQLPSIRYQIQLREDDIRRRQYLRNHFRDPLRPDSSEVRAEYERRIAEFTRPETRVFFAINVASLDAAQKVAEMMRRDAPLPEIESAFTPADSFQSTPINGTPPMKYGDSPLLDDVLFSLALGEVSDPIPVNSTYTVAKVLKIEPAEVIPLEVAQNTIIPQMVDARQAAELERVIAEARRNHPVTIHQDALSKVRPRRPK